ncbi:MAG: hypothetical protein M3188_03375 [Actinomycetota bacterium]|nr:hypothetical protein [Actinomycetota bacterium]
MALLLATVAAFALAERLKLERSPVTAPRFTRLIGPECGCEKARADLRVRLRQADRVTAMIVGEDGEEVRRLATRLERPRGRVRFVWDGRDGAGKPAADGLYRLRLELERADRTITIPTPVRVDGTPPRLRLVSATPRAITPDGDGRADRVLYVYRSSERAYAVVYVNGRYTVRGRSWRRGRGRVRWRARVEGGGYVEPGVYRTWIEAVDPAGNRSERSPVVTVRVRR